MPSFSLDVFRSTDAFRAFAGPWAIRFAVALLIFLVGRMLLRVVLPLSVRGMRRANADETLVMFISKVLYGLGLTIIIVTALGELGVATTSAAAVLGGGALAIGLALQQQLASFAAGVLIIVFRPFRVGHWIEAAGKSGTVVEVNIFSTLIHTIENKAVHIPNAKIWSEAIVNASSTGWQRLDLTIGISYDSDLKRAKHILEELFSQDDRVLKDPPASIVVKALSANTVDFACRAATKTSDAWGVQCTLLESVALRFAEAGIRVPTGDASWGRTNAPSSTDDPALPGKKIAQPPGTVPVG